MKKFNLFLIITIFSLGFPASALAVTVPATYPTTWSSDCTGTGYHCTDYRVYFDEATSFTDDTIADIGLKRLACIDGTDATAWINSAFAKGGIYGTHSTLPDILFTGSQAPSTANPAIYCTWAGFWRYDGSSWTPDPSDGSNIPVSDSGIGPPIVANFSMYSDRDLDFGGRYGLGVVQTNDVIWTPDGVASGSATATASSFAQCDTLDLLCSIKQYSFNLVNFFFGFNSSLAAGQIDSLHTTLNSKAPFAYVNAVFAIDLSNTATSEAVPTFTLALPATINTPDGHGGTRATSLPPTTTYTDTGPISGFMTTMRPLETIFLWMLMVAWLAYDVPKRIF